MKEHQFYVKNCIFSLTFVIIVFALQLCIKPLHFHTTAHYSSSHTSHVQSEKQVSSLSSAFLLLSPFCIFPCSPLHACSSPSSYPILHCLPPSHSDPLQSPGKPTMLNTWTQVSIASWLPLDPTWKLL